MFDNHFEVFIADTAESKKIHFSIRYQVYCEEMGFESKDDFPEQMEYDEHDDRSVHFIVRDKTSGLWIGAMRLIYKKGDLLPIEQCCEINEKVDSNDLFGAVELSRLCLIKEARRRIKDIDPPCGIIGESSQALASDKVKLFPNQYKLNRLIIWGLIYAASEYCSSNNIHNWYFMTTFALAKVLRKGGLNLVSIGESFSHKGERFPFKMNATETYQSTIWHKYNNGCQYFSRMHEHQLSRATSAA